MFLKHTPPHLDSTCKPILRNQLAPFGRKFLRGTGLVLASEALEMTVLFLSPYSFSKWERSQFPYIGKHYTEAFTKPPLLDNDGVFTNLFAHPYQGAFEYNCLRSQGANIWQSVLFAALHSTFWEYAIEGSEERPSVQDLLITPIAGSLLGELVHFATMRMSRNGFTWYEGLFVCLLNPAFLLNNGFKFAKPLKKNKCFNP